MAGGEGEKEEGEVLTIIVCNPICSIHYNIMTTWLSTLIPQPSLVVEFVTYDSVYTHIIPWPQVNGEAIYNSIPWRAQNDTSTQLTWYTASKNLTFVYAITFEKLTPGGEVVLKQPKTTPSTQIYLLGFTGSPLSFTVASNGVHVKIPDIIYDELKYAWVFKMMGVE